MADAAAAQKALYEAIQGAAEESASYGGVTRSAMVRDAAIAYRAVVGGQQPGSVVVESK